MKLITNKTVLLILIAFVLVMVNGPLTAQVYKVVDKDGNVTYTDRSPTAGAKPVDLPPISVIDSPVYETRAKPDEAEVAADVPSLRDMRRNYSDFEITSPQPEQSLWQPDQATTVAWNVRYQLLEGMQVTVFLNGQQYTTSTERIIPIGELDRGEHTVSAELKDAKNRKIATAKPVTFYIRRPSIYTNRPGATPRG